MFDVTQVAEAIAAAKNPDGAWHAVSNHLKAQGLHRTALHTHLPLAADNPFGDPGTGRAFGHVWDAEHDRKLRAYSGDVRRAGEPDLWGLRPTLKFLAMSRSPLFVDHRNQRGIRLRDGRNQTGRAGLAVGVGDGPVVAEVAK